MNACSPPPARPARDCGRGACLLAVSLAAPLVGVVLLLAALLKARDPLGFAGEIGQLARSGGPVAWGLVAWAVIVGECLLGAALLTGMRPRVALPLAAATLLAFLGALVWRWHLGLTGDCGCFGPWKRPLSHAFVDDFVLLALVGVAWCRRRTLIRKTAAAPRDPGQSKRGEATAIQRATVNRIRLIFVGGTVLLGIALPVRGGILDMICAAPETMASTRLGSAVANGLARPAPADGIPRLSAAEVHDGLARHEVILIDVRPVRKWQERHIRGAISYPFHDPPEAATPFPHGPVIVAYCA